MRYLLTGTVLIFGLAGQAQNAFKFHHKISQALLNRYGFQIRTDDAANTLMTIGGKLKCVLASDGKGKITADIWQINNTTQHPDPHAGSTTVLNSTTPTTKFHLTDNRVSLGQPTRVLKVPFSALTFSIGTTPLRIRAKTDSSSATISTALGLSFSPGYTFGKSIITGRAMNNYSITIGPFIGLSTADIKKETVKTPLIWDAQKTPARVLPAFSYGASITFSRNNFGFVASAGADAAFGSKAKAWSYQNKLWLGLGINTNLSILK